MGRVRIGTALVFWFFSVSIWALPQGFESNRCVNEPQYFSPKQKAVLLKAYEYGAPHDLGYTLAAIAWKESCAGEYRMNFQDPSAGIYHAHLPGLIKKYPSLKQNGFTQNVLGALLVKDDAFAAREAISELKYWEKVHQGNWERMIKSYNKGFSWQKDSQSNRLAEDYYQDVKEKVKRLQAFLPRLKLDKYTSLESSNRVSLPIYEKRRLTPIATPNQVPSKEPPAYGTTRVVVKSRGKAGEFDLLPDQ
ncbi:conserved hypothetical protein [Wolinella succinogenes]|uniref:Transglycosylase SLT domain-containing protein n=1 Tax=Wolinella succinogenes (strain ATCC 29543 / DSM 1740 / CCUG 13145 / JCM 31913 / LMG 7466 / NCTC 11488 / FDC 602W) TaxID=273121 RepID=Q7MSQ9_WOLSU|nr:conserved hypothetical protein [Wolinella succinogenes]VEG81582.1 Uncharacterised protein [Wolinella succinogenes]HCZ18891.1 hypothetical protein [Helicobacter sp.]